MKVILLHDVSALGRKNEIKKVSGGYARNFLLPQKLAEPATDAAMRALVVKKARDEEKKAEEEKRHREAAKKLKNTTLAFTMKIGERGKAFGSVTTQKIADELKKQGITTEKEWITLDEPIKTTGEHAVSIAFPHDIEGKIRIIVEPE